MYQRTEDRECGILKGRGVGIGNAECGILEDRGVGIRNWECGSGKTGGGKLRARRQRCEGRKLRR